MPNNCTLLINNQIYGGWKEITIERGIEQMSGGFSLKVTEHWPDQVEDRPIKPGDVCVVKIDDEPVVTGYVDRVHAGYDANQTWFNVDGRDKTADLVDSSAIHKSGQWKSATVKQIASDLCMPFGIGVVIGQRGAQKATEPVHSFSLEDGETVQDALTRLLRMKALMMWTDGTGRLVIDLPGRVMALTSLTQGENILSAELQQDETQQFAEYIVKGQGRHGKHDTKGSAKDSTVSRYRPLIILAEDQTQNPAERAKYEVTVRRGKADRANVRVQSWRQGGDMGPLWAPGLRVIVNSAHIHKTEAEMIIASLIYTKNENEGTVCSLNVANPDAFDTIAQNPKPKHQGSKGKHKGKRRGKRGRKRGRKSSGYVNEDFDF